MRARIYVGSEMVGEAEIRQPASLLRRGQTVRPGIGDTVTLALFDEHPEADSLRPLFVTGKLERA